MSIWTFPKYGKSFKLNQVILEWNIRDFNIWSWFSKIVNPTRFLETQVSENSMLLFWLGNCRSILCKKPCFSANFKRKKVMRTWENFIFVHIICYYTVQRMMQTNIKMLTTLTTILACSSNIDSLQQKFCFLCSTLTYSCF